MRFLFVLSAACLLALAAAVPSDAQGTFAPAVRVNDRIITEYEIRQRLRFLQVLRAPGATRDAVVDELINDRLKMDAMAQAGVTVNEEDLLAAMGEFAGRVNLEMEPFVNALAQEGVDRETFRDFVSIGIGWRDYVRQRFGPRARVTEDEIDRRIALTSTAGGLRVLLSEIVLPNTPDRAEDNARLIEEIQQIETTGAFADAARRLSAAPTGPAGGALEWFPISNLPVQLRQIVLSLSPGEVSAPVPAGNALILFQLRDIEETDVPETEFAAVEYAMFYIPGGRSDTALAEAARVRAQVDTCDDLYGVAHGLPEDRLERVALPPAEVPTDIAVELARLDAGEVSTALTRANGQTLVFLMMCGRTPAIGEDVDRQQIRRVLFSERLESLSDGFVADLRADAVIQIQ